MSNALKEYIVTAQNRVERALDLRLPSEKTSSPQTSSSHALYGFRWW